MTMKTKSNFQKFNIMKKFILFFALFAMCLGVKAQTEEYGWNYLCSLGNVNINSICCISEDTVILVGSGGTIFKTTNGGATWVQKESNTTENLFSVDFLNDTLGFAVGINTILCTNDGGENWFSAENKFDFNIAGCVIDNINVSSTGNSCVMLGYKYNYGFNSILMISHDMGDTWSIDSTFNVYDRMDILCMQSDTLFFVNYGNMVLRTNNDGESYDTVLQDDMIKDILIYGNDLFVVTSYALKKSNDFGNSWQDISSEDDFEFYYVKLSAVDSCSLFVYSEDMPGSQSRFFNYCDDIFSDYTRPIIYPAKFIGNTGYGIEQVSSRSSVYKYGIKVNAQCEKTESTIHIYPNPSSSFFTISLPNMETEGLEYSIYDVMGRLVERNIIDNMPVTVENSNRQSGIYEVIVSRSGEMIYSEKFIKE